MRFGDRIFDVVTVCAVPAFAFLLWDLVRVEFVPVKLAWAPLRLLYLVLMLFPLVYLPATGAALAVGWPTSTPWRWRRSGTAPPRQRPLRRPGAALALLFLGTILLSVTLDRLPDLQEHFRLYLRPCILDLQEPAGDGYCYPVPAPAFGKWILAGLMLGGPVIGFALLLRTAPILAWLCLRRRRPGWRPAVLAGGRGRWRFGERLGTALLIALGLSLLLLAFDAVRTGFRAPTLEWIPLAVLFGPVLLFGPVYLGLLIATRPRPGGPARTALGRPRPLLTAVALAFSCGCWLPALLFLALAHTATDLHYEQCENIPIPYPPPFLGSEGGSHAVCVPETALSTGLLLGPALQIGLAFSAAILFVWAISAFLRRRGWPWSRQARTGP